MLQSNKINVDDENDKNNLNLMAKTGGYVELFGSQY